MEALPDDVLAKIIPSPGFHDEIHLQLVSKRLCDLLTSPCPQLHLWGVVDLLDLRMQLMPCQDSRTSSIPLVP